jgi:hypothetical protein
VVSAVDGFFSGVSGRWIAVDGFFSGVSGRWIL